MPEEKNQDKIYSVSELNTLSQSVLEHGVGEVWVRGEVSGLKIQSSGHIYFSLKDEGSVISVALFKGTALKSSVKLSEGKQILVFGEVGIYLPRGSYQMVAKFLFDEGAGRLRQEFEKLKKQLEIEGIFAKERKIQIPRLPQTVAFITSPTGAVWQDFTRILQRRDWRGRVILFPCRVQGAEAPAEIVECLQRADNWAQRSPSGGSDNETEISLFTWAQENKFTTDKTPDNINTIDLVVIGRGGGSLEDLWAFNDERVVRTVAAMRTPIISAVGHETDFTLCDFAADFRAETPSAAAELIAGQMNEIRTKVKSLSMHLLQFFRRTTMLYSQKIEGLGARLMGRSPRLILDRATQHLDEIDERMRHSVDYRLKQARERLATLNATLNGLDPQITLRRGYAMVRGVDGRLITKASMVKAGQEVELRWADNNKRATIK